MQRKTFHPLIVISAVIALSFVIISLAPSPADLVRNEVQTMRNDALALANNGQTDQAIRKLRLLQKNYPSQTELLIDQLQVLHNAGRDEELLDLFASIELQMASTQTLDMLIQAASANNAGYTLLYGAALDLLPNKPYLATRLGEHLLNYKPTMAKELLLEATRLSPNNQDLQFLAAKSFRDSDYLAALNHIENYLQANFNHSEALSLYISLIMQHAQQQSPQIALNRLPVVAIAAEQTPYKNTRLLLSAWAEDYVTVQMIISDEQPQADDILSISKVLRSLNQPTAAERICRAAISSHPDNTELHLALSYTLIDQRRIREAKYIINEINAPESAPLQLANAAAEEALGHFDNALDYIELASILDPSLELNTRWSKNLLRGLEKSKPAEVSRRIALWQNNHIIPMNEAFNLANTLRRAGFSSQATQLTIGLLSNVPAQ